MVNIPLTLILNEQLMPYSKRVPKAAKWSPVRLNDAC